MVLGVINITPGDISIQLLYLDIFFYIFTVTRYMFWATARAITKIRDFYKLKDWVGDPCEPQNLTWNGLICSNDDSEHHRIVAL